MTNAGMMRDARGYGFNAVQCGYMISCTEESESQRFILAVMPGYSIREC